MERGKQGGSDEAVEITQHFPRQAWEDCIIIPNQSTQKTWGFNTRWRHIPLPDRLEDAVKQIITLLLLFDHSLFCLLRILFLVTFIKHVGNYK